MLRRIWMLVGLFCSLASVLVARVQAQPTTEGDPAGTIVVWAEDKTQITLTGDAKVDQPLGAPAQYEALGLKGKKIISLGKWSKPNTGPAQLQVIPKITQAGVYDVYVYTYAPKLTAGMPKSAPLKLEYDGGNVEMEYRTQIGNAWVFLGSYPFKPGDSGRLTMDIKGLRGTANLVAAKFVPLADAKKALAPRPKVLPVTKGPADDFDKLRLHAAELLTVSANADLSDPLVRSKVIGDGVQAYQYWKTLQKQEGITDLWADLRTAKPIERNEGGGWPLRDQFNRVLEMARMYVGANAATGFADKMQGNPELLRDIFWALDWLYTNRYNDRSKNKLGADWIAMEIIIPQSMANCMILLYPEYPKDLMQKQLAAIEKICPGPDRFYGGAISTGSNRFFGVYSYALRSIVTKDAKALARVDDLIQQEFDYNNRSNPIQRGGKGTKASFDGYYTDGSFIQHGALPYIGIYGRALLERFGNLAELLKGSPWELKDPKSAILYDWVYRGYLPLFFQGEIMYGSLGRSTGQSWHQNGAVSSEIINAIAMMVPGAPAPEAAKLKSILKTWLVEKAQSSFPQFSELKPERIDVPSASTIAAILKDSSIPLTHPREGSYIFHNTDYVVHHQKDFAAQLRMFSTRIITHEDINEGTNRLGWYQGYGTLLLYDRDNSRYNDNFWCTVNPYRLPGITVDTRPREAPGAKNGQYSTSPYAGGAEIDGFGAAGMALIAPDTTLTANKSWFFVKDQIICLGSDIQSKDNRTIETIVENVKLWGEGGNALRVNGQAQPAALGWKADLKDVQWLHLAGNVPGSDLGVVFPGSSQLKALREERTGNWQDSFVKDKDNNTYKRPFLTLWYDHGANPAGVGYAYILLPHRAAEAVQAYAQQPLTQILARSSAVHAVACPSVGVTAANFWTQAGGKGGSIASSGKSIVVLHEEKDTFSLGVADPTQLETTVTITLDLQASKVVNADPNVTVLSLNPVKLVINLDKSDGKTFRVSCAR